MSRVIDWAIAVPCAAALVCGCSDPDTLLVVNLVPNPEVNTTDQVVQAVNRLEITLDAEGGFAALDVEAGETWGPYLASDVDEDGVLELVLSRPAGDALEPFALTAGHQAGRVLTIQAHGIDTEGALAALGGASGGFREDAEAEIEVPFNLVPSRRPLKVVSMTPAVGSQDIPPPVEGVAVQLGGYVLASALEGHVHLFADDLGEELAPALAVSYVETGMGRATTVHFGECPLNGGEYRVTVDVGVCTTTGQCLDQHLSLEGPQPFEGGFAVAGDPEPPGCPAVTTMGGGCPVEGCPSGYDCDHDFCVPTTENPESLPGGLEASCDEGLCEPPLFVCSGGTCVPDCRVYGACPDPAWRCDLETGACLTESDRGSG